MTTTTRRRIHVSLAVFFAVQVPAALWLQIARPDVFDRVWKAYLVFLSLYAIVVGHWSASAAETPFEEGDV